MDGIEIKIARIRAGVRAFELAHSIGLSESALSRIETGRRVAGPDELARLMAAVDSLAVAGRIPVGAGSRGAHEPA